MRAATTSQRHFSPTITQEPSGVLLPRVGRLRKGIILVSVTGLLVAVLWMAATPGSLVTTRTASGQMANREAFAALVGLIVLGMIALGIGFEDML
jgi:hypothetical protein